MSDFSTITGLQNLSGTPTFVAAFLIGVLSGYNPCCFPMIPAVVATASASQPRTTRFSFFTALSFVLGLSIVTSLMGMLAASLGIVFGQIPTWLRYTAAMVPALMGLAMLDVLPMGKITTGNFFGNRVGTGILGSFLTGIAFSFAILPCATPALVALLTIAAEKSQLLAGGFLLFLYSIGAGVPLVLVGTFFGKVTASKLAMRYGQLISRATGVVLIFLSMYLLYGI